MRKRMKRFELDPLLGKEMPTTELHPQWGLGQIPDHTDTMQYDGTQGQALRGATQQT